MSNLSQHTPATVLDEYLVAVLDILGIKNMMANADDQTLNHMSVCFSEALQRCNEDVRKHHHKELESLGKSDFKEVYDSLYNESKFLTFSDTLVLTLNLSKMPAQTPRSSNAATSLFFAKVRYATNALYCYGLPVRGCIDIGTLLWRDNFIFGKPFANAFSISDALDFSGVVVTDQVMERFRSSPIDAISVLQKCRLPVPIKGCQKDVYMHCVDWMGFYYENKGCIDTQELFSKFCMHGKLITGAIERKIRNTEYILREMKSQADYLADNRTHPLKNYTAN